MRMKRLLGCFIFLIGMAAQSQDINEFVEQRLRENDITQILPPLDSLIQWAKEHSPKLKYYEEDLKSFELKKKEAGTDWLDVFSLGAGYSYGIFDNLNNQQLVGDPNASQILLSTQQSRYNLNAAVKIPLNTLLGRSRDMKQAELGIKKAEYTRQIIENELTELVIARYYELVGIHENFLITSTMVDTYRVRAQTSKKNYENGVIGFNEFNTSHQMLNDAIKAKAGQRTALAMALRYLQEVVGLPINLTQSEI